MEDDQWLPVLDLRPYLRGEPGALEALATDLREACEGVGFYFLENMDAGAQPLSQPRSILAHAVTRSCDPTLTAWVRNMF